MEWEAAGKGSGTSGVPGGGSKKRKGRGCLVAILVIAAIIAFVNVRSCIANQPKSLDWPSSGLAELLPKPASNKGEVHSNSSSTFDADVAKTSESDYQAYIEACKDKGFTVDPDEMSSMYVAFDESGNRLSLSYYSSSEKMSISLDAAEELGSIAWPATGAASLVPAPSSTTGKITTDSASSFFALVGGMDKDAWSSYVDSCMNAGFNVDYKKTDDSFTATNADGAKLTVEYRGAKVVKIDVKVADKPAADNSASESSSSSSSNSDFRQFVDDYEAFMNSYCDFMEKYNAESDKTSMLAEYGKLVQEELDWVQKFDSYDTSNASAEDVAYYTAANARVLDRLSKIQ